MHSLVQNKSFDKSEKEPLVVSFIGQDDPYRGDSRGSVGLGREVAKLINANHHVVSEYSLAEHFNSLASYQDRLKSYVDMVQSADIVIGRGIEDFLDLMLDYGCIPYFMTQATNEYTASIRSAYKGALVAHDLTQDTLLNEAGVFKSHYPDIKGSLVGVLLGGCCCDPDQLAKQLLLKAEKHEALTFFICPSGRTDFYYQELLDEIKVQRGDMFPELTVLGKEYEKCVDGYNPYYGLLGSADHLVLLGESGSMLSEALYTGKPLHVSKFTRENTERLFAEGRLIALEQVTDRPFLSRSIGALDVTKEIALSIARDYEMNKQQRLKNQATVKP